jgi:hypothetical protein
MEIGKQHISTPPVIASQVLQRTTTFFHMIHPITSMNWCSSLEFAIIWLFSHENAIQQHLHTNQPKTHFQKNLLLFLRPLNFSPSPLSTIKNQPLDWISASLNILGNRFSCTLVGYQDLIPLLEKPLPSFKKLKPHYLSALLLILLSLHREISADYISLGSSLAT